MVSSVVPSCDGHLPRPDAQVDGPSLVGGGCEVLVPATVAVVGVDRLLLPAEQPTTSSTRPAAHRKGRRRLLSCAMRAPAPRARRTSPAPRRSDRLSVVIWL